MEREIDYRPCTNVLMLNPRVGLTPVISSSLSFFNIVVFPALSRPLPKVVRTREFPAENGDLQKQQPHFLLFLPVLPYYSEQPHKKSLPISSQNRNFDRIGPRNWRFIGVYLAYGSVGEAKFTTSTSVFPAFFLYATQIKHVL